MKLRTLHTSIQFPKGVRISYPIISLGSYYFLAVLFRPWIFLTYAEWLGFFVMIFHWLILCFASMNLHGSDETKGYFSIIYILLNWFLYRMFSFEWIPEHERFGLLIICYSTLQLVNPSVSFRNLINFESNRGFLQ